jgi:xeroderma pigmentosum group C-complementing protein
MSYVVAFEEDGAAQDVTRRYAKAYNAKSRKSRVEVTKGGERWWRRTMRVFRRGWDLDRDQVEDAELTAKKRQKKCREVCKTSRITRTMHWSAISNAVKSFILSVK